MKKSSFQFPLILLLLMNIHVHVLSGKIAFLFLTQNEIPFEDIWREFFTWNANESEYSIYTHPHASYSFPKNSFFWSTEVDNRVNVKWGGISLVEANQVLVRAALKDPDNQYFCLFSESCIPVQPFTVWKHLLAHNKSVIKACESNNYNSNDNRWKPNLGIPADKWRKSENWFALIRKHAEIFAQTKLTGWDKVFAADEHIIPATIATLELEHETTCGLMTMISWKYSTNRNHPGWLGVENVTTSLIEQLHSLTGLSTGNGACSNIPNVCHFAGRKFDHTAARPIMDHLHILFHDSIQNISYDNRQYERLFPLLRTDITRRHYFLLNTTKEIRCPLTIREMVTHATQHTPQSLFYLRRIPLFTAMQTDSWPVNNITYPTLECM